MSPLTPPSPPTGGEGKDEGVLSSVKGFIAFVLVFHYSSIPSQKGMGYSQLNHV
jgi:hypothetical protein